MSCSKSVLEGVFHKAVLKPSGNGAILQAWKKAFLLLLRIWLWDNPTFRNCVGIFATICYLCYLYANLHTNIHKYPYTYICMHRLGIFLDYITRNNSNCLWESTGNHQWYLDNISSYTFWNILCSYITFFNLLIKNLKVNLSQWGD